MKATTTRPKALDPGLPLFHDPLAQQPGPQTHTRGGLEDGPARDGRRIKRGMNTRARSITKVIEDLRLLELDPTSAYLRND